MPEPLTQRPGRVYLVIALFVGFAAELRSPCRILCLFSDMDRNIFLFESFTQWRGLVNFFRTVFVGFAAESKGALFFLNFSRTEPKQFLFESFAQ